MFVVYSNDMVVIPNSGTLVDRWVNPPVLVMFNILGGQRLVTWDTTVLDNPLHPILLLAGDGLARTLARVHQGGVKLFCLATYQGMVCS